MAEAQDRLEENEELKKENEKLEEEFQKFLEKEFPGTIYELENDIIQTMKISFKAGALAGIDLFVSSYHTLSERFNDDTAGTEDV